MQKTAPIFAAILSVGMACTSLQAQDTDVLTAEEYVDLVQDIDFVAHTLSPAEFMARRAGENVVVFDLRQKSSFDHGHIVGAIHLGTDITKAKLLALVPDQNTTILIYCSNSLFPTRMISLTTITLPQIIALGYDNTFMLADSFGREDGVTIPMTGN